MDSSAAIAGELKQRNNVALSLAPPSVKTAGSKASASCELGVPCVDPGSSAQQGCDLVALTVAEPARPAKGPLTTRRGPLNTERHAMREALTAALNRLGPLPSCKADAVMPSLAERGPSQQPARNPLAAAGALVAPAQDGEWEARQASVKAGCHSASVKAPQLAVVVADAVHDRSPAVQSAARTALAAMGPATASHLIPAVSHASPRRRRSAAHALGELGTAIMAQAESTASSTIAPALADSSREVRQAGLELMEGTRCPANALVRSPVRAEAADFPPFAAPAAQVWTRSAHETFAPTSAAHLPPWTWRSRIKCMRAHRCAPRGA